MKRIVRELPTMDDFQKGDMAIMQNDGTVKAEKYIPSFMRILPQEEIRYPDGGYSPICREH